MSERPPERKADRRIEIRKLGVLNQLGELGVDGVESRLGKLAGRPTAVESDVVKNGYVDASSVDLAFPAEKRLGVTLKEHQLSGHSDSRNAFSAFQLFSSASAS